MQKAQRRIMQIRARRLPRMAGGASTRGSDAPRALIRVGEAQLQTELRPRPIASSDVWQGPDQVDTE